MELDIGSQALACCWAGLEGIETNVPAFAVEKYRREANVGAHIENAIAIAQLDAVSQVAPVDKNFAMDETRFIGIQRKYC